MFKLCYNVIAKLINFHYWIRIVGFRNRKLNDSNFRLQVLNWRKRGTADGFSSINLVLPVLMLVFRFLFFFSSNIQFSIGTLATFLIFTQLNGRNWRELFLENFRMGCWLRHGFMTNDFTNIFINTINLVVFAGYILAFAFYQPCRVNISLLYCRSTSLRSI